MTKGSRGQARHTSLMARDRKLLALFHDYVTKEIRHQYGRLSEQDAWRFSERTLAEYAEFLKALKGMDELKLENVENRDPRVLFLKTCESLNESDLGGIIFAEVSGLLAIARKNFSNR